MVIVACVIITRADAALITSTWLGATGEWSDVLQWDTPGFPNNGVDQYNAVVSGGDVTVDLNVTINGLTVNGGTIRGPNGLTSNTVIWTGGTMTGSGTTQATVAMDLSGTTKTLNGGRIIENFGTASWTAGNFDTGDGAQFHNHGVLTTDFDGSFQHNLGGSATVFENDNGFSKVGGVGTTTFATVFNNSGDVIVSSGTLSLEGGGTHTGGFHALSPGNLAFGGGTHDLNGANVIGSGTVTISSGTVNVSGASSYSVGTTVLSSGTLGVGTTINSTSFLQIGGSLVLNGGGVLSLGTIDIQGGSVQGTGLIHANVDNSGLISPGLASQAKIDIHGDVALLSASHFLAEIGGVNQGTDYDWLEITGSVALDGTLIVELVDGFDASIQVGDTFTVLSASSLSGSVANAAHGETITIGAIELQVNYGPNSSFGANSVVISTALVPEPSTLEMVAVGVVVTLTRRSARRTRRRSS